MRQRQCYLHEKCEKEMNKGKKRDTAQISSWYKRWKCCVTTKEKLFAASTQSTRCLRLLLSCLRYWTSFLPGWPHIDDTLSIYSEHCEREHITIVHGPRGSRDKSILCLFSREAELTGTRLWLTFLLSRHPTLNQARPEQAALLQLTSSWETQAQPASGAQACHCVTS